MVLQRVDSMYDLEWAPGVKYRDVRLREEIEQSKYVFGQVDMPAGDFGTFHRDLFERLLSARRGAAQGRPGLAGARAHAQVLASVQHSRLEQQHRRDRTDRLHPARAAARRRHREGVRRRRPPPKAVAVSAGSRAAARDRLRRTAGGLAARADQPDRRGRRRAACASTGCRRSRRSKPSARRGG